MLTLNRVTDGDLHTLADFAELLCLVKPDRVLSIEDLDDHLVDEAGEVRGRRPIADAFAHLLWRENAFGGVYPFNIAINRQSFSAPDELSENQKAYVLLLLCSNLPYVGKGEIKGLTDAFERVAECALKKIWPKAGEVRKFGKNNTQYTGTKAERLRTLAQEIGCRPSVDASSFRRHDSGDGGIDLAAWLDLDAHEGENKLSALAQCACSREEWSNKQYEISQSLLGKLLRPTAPWMEFVFIPICFRDNNGRWAVEADVASTLLIDRLRLLRFFDADLDWGEINPPDYLLNFLNFRLELV